MEFGAKILSTDDKLTKTKLSKLSKMSIQKRNF